MSVMGERERERERERGGGTFSSTNLQAGGREGGTFSYMGLAAREREWAGTLIKGFPFLLHVMLCIGYCFFNFMVKSQFGISLLLLPVVYFLTAPITVLWRKQLIGSCKRPEVELH